MTQGLEVLQAGALTTIQDRGRPGYGDQGVGWSGAADVRALDAANRLVGNRPSAACLELTLGGFVAKAQTAMVCAVTGAPAPIFVGNKQVAHHEQIIVPAGATLKIGMPTAGLRTYLAVRGGIAGPVILGSRSTDTLSGLGPPPIRRGDVVAVATDEGEWPAVDVIPQGFTDPSTGPATIRIQMGPRAEWFDASAPHLLTSQTYEVTADSNRVGARLAGPERLKRARDDELSSEGMVPGALQVPPEGQPVLFLADHPVTGGYPVIAVALDLSAAAQLRPGDKVRFTTSTIW
ncbi:5-oxoprolinase subunit C family protein [Hoyosella subflava]|uniref:Carboxyltransferase domain-containing protein n=1 Tax=Hoyosella subflava (strain DSM 45089 / JCM 17490 / NBRC 109087 / DQS3-9A1) TaxID=443218 RepID=F6EKD2_HOYSD|nr:biotin-dependent carboxyltransferase family protein [Hoyosella subflava]AEF39103.1 hypothetical protein AS9A_0649 [Hoyosella subflava DQS3-9A1]